MESEIVELRCKGCNKILNYVKGSAIQEDMIHLQSGAYCDSCLPKLFEKDASVILFIIDAAWGEYSKRVEFRGGQYYSAESRVRGVITPIANIWNEHESAHEIGFDEALSYAKSHKDIENLKFIESIRKKRSL